MQVTADQARCFSMKIPLLGRGGADHVFKTGTVVLMSFSLPWISRHLAGILYLLNRWCSGVGNLALWFQSFEWALFWFNFKELLSGLASTLRTLRLA